VAEAAWIGERLAPFESSVVTSVVPGGFEAYARVLHPAEEPSWGDRLVRWAEVAAWSGMPLRRDAQFHTVALPPDRPAADAPWSGQGPREGSLYPPDAEVLAEIAAAWTATPGHCWFCVWDGYGWDNIAPLTAAGQPTAAPPPDPLPAAVRSGPRVHLPHRDYLLYRGPAGAVTATCGLADEQQAANLWWPQDRAWCVASGIDLPWSYVAGPAGLIEHVLADTRIEALPAGPGDPLARVEDWVTGWAEQAAADLFATGEAVITTSRGTVQAWLSRPAWRRGRALRTQASGDNGVTGSSTRNLGRDDDQELRRDVVTYLTFDLIELVGG